MAERQDCPSGECVDLQLLKEKVELNTKNIENNTEKLEETIESTHGIKLIVSVFTEKMDGFTTATNVSFKSLQDAITSLQDAVGEINKKPAKLVDKLVNMLIGSGIGGVVAFLVMQLLSK